MSLILELLNHVFPPQVDVWSLLQLIKSHASTEIKQDVKSRTFLVAANTIGDRKSGEIELSKVCNNNKSAFTN